MFLLTFSDGMNSVYDQQSSALFTYRSSLRIILGPLLFSLYIHDLPPVCCGDGVQMYDDDIRIYCQIEMVSNI